MKKSNRLAMLKCLLIIAFGGLIISGCKKVTAEDNDTTGAAENSFAETSFNEAGHIADQAGSGSVSSFRYAGNNADAGVLLSSCASLRFDTINHQNPDTITVNFGTSNCTCVDGRNRRGKIFITYTKPHYRDSGNVITISFINYFVNDYQIMGTKTINNNGHINGHLTYTISISGTIVKPNNGGSFTWTAGKTRTWLQGENTPLYWADDIYTFTGSSSGYSSDGNHYTATTVSPLYRDLSCPRWIVRGVMNFSPNNKPTRSIDFGGGACDDIAIVTINNHSYTIHMR